MCKYYIKITDATNNKDDNIHKSEANDRQTHIYKYKLKEHSIYLTISRSLNKNPANVSHNYMNKRCCFNPTYIFKLDYKNAYLIA